MPEKKPNEIPKLWICATSRKEVIVQKMNLDQYYNKLFVWKLNQKSKEKLLLLFYSQHSIVVWLLHIDCKFDYY